MQQNQVNFLNSRIDAPIQNFVNRTFEIIKVLGQGGEGTVYLCKSINWGVNDQKQFALKCQNQSKAEEVQFIDNLILYQNQYENLINKGKSNYQPSGLIRIYDRFKSNNKDFIVMELGELDLYTYINQQQQNLTFDQKLNILIQLAQSISYLHKLNLIHRDIKPENFIKVADQFKLIDFGLTRINEGRLMTRNVGTPLFQAPEIVENLQNYTQAVDIWSLGCVYHEILTQQPLFQEQTYQEVANKIKNCKIDKQYLQNKLEQLPYNEQNKDNLKILLLQMLEPFYQQRISINVVIEKLKSFKNQNIIPPPQQPPLQPLQPLQSLQQPPLQPPEIIQLQDQMKEMGLKLNNICQIITDIRQIKNSETQFTNDVQEQFKKIQLFMQNQIPVKDQFIDISRLMQQSLNEQQKINQQLQQNENSHKEQFQEIMKSDKQQNNEQFLNRKQVELDEKNLKLQEYINQINEQQTQIRSYNEKQKQLEEKVQQLELLNKQDQQRFQDLIKSNDIEHNQKQKELETKVQQLELLNKQDQQRFQDLLEINRNLSETIKKQEFNISELLKQQQSLFDKQKTQKIQSEQQLTELQNKEIKNNKKFLNNEYQQFTIKQQDYNQTVSKLQVKNETINRKIQQASELNTQNNNKNKFIEETLQNLFFELQKNKSNNQQNVQLKECSQQQKKQIKQQNLFQNNQNPQSQNQQRKNQKGICQYENSQSPTKYHEQHNLLQNSPCPNNQEHQFMLKQLLGSKQLQEKTREYEMDSEY